MAVYGLITGASKHIQILKDAVGETGNLLEIGITVLFTGSGPALGNAFPVCSEAELVGTFIRFRFLGWRGKFRIHTR